MDVQEVNVTEVNVREVIEPEKWPAAPGDAEENEVYLTVVSETVGTSTTDSAVTVEAECVDRNDTLERLRERADGTRRKVNDALDELVPESFEPLNDMLFWELAKRNNTVGLSVEAEIE